MARKKTQQQALIELSADITKSPTWLEYQNAKKGFESKKNKSDEEEFSHRLRQIERLLYLNLVLRINKE